MLKIGRLESDGRVTLVLSGRIEQEHVAELQRLLDAESGRTDLTFDLEEVRLVDREAVKFLAACQAGGVQLKDCPSYIREWIETGSNKTDEP